MRAHRQSKQRLQSDILSPNAANVQVEHQPGSFFEVIEIKNVGSTATLPELVLDATTPEEVSFLGFGNPAFKLRGIKPVKVYLNGVDITPPGQRLPDLSSLLVDHAGFFEVVLWASTVTVQLTKSLQDLSSFYD